MDVHAKSSPPLHRSAVLLDIQCFKDNNNDYLLKEASVVNVNTGTLLLHHIARAPFDRDLLSEDKLRESYWLTKHCHGLDWNRGDISYYLLMDKLRSCLARRSIIYVKGSQKKDFVQRHLVTDSTLTVVIDMSDIGCGSLESTNNLLSSTSIRCGRHKSEQSRCALTNCIVLRSWLLLTDNNNESLCNSLCFCCCPHHIQQQQQDQSTEGIDTVDSILSSILI